MRCSLLPGETRRGEWILVVDSPVELAVGSLASCSSQRAEDLVDLEQVGVVTETVEINGVNLELRRRDEGVVRTSRQRDHAGARVVSNQLPHALAPH